MNAHLENYIAPPSALRYTLQAFRPSSGWNAQRGFPDLRMAWRGLRIEADAMQSLTRLAGSDAPPAAETLALLIPQVTGFRLLMATLTHPLWPLPIWRALQVRNRLLLHRPFRAGDTFDLFTQIAGWRVHEKGLEVDLQSRLQQGELCAWESVVTFYYRGRFGPAAKHGVALGAATSSPIIDDRGEKSAQWRVDGKERWHFGALTGDYNGIHQSDWYARRLGFKAAFAHPQRIAAQCLARLPAPIAAPSQLDLWIKGPVFFGGEVILRQANRPSKDGVDFALWISGDARPALVGSWCRR